MILTPPPVPPHVTVTRPGIPANWPLLIGCGLVAAVLLFAWGKLGPLGKVLLVVFAVALVIGYASIGRK